MVDPVIKASKSKAMDVTKDYLRWQLQRYYCEAGGSQGACNANVEFLVDVIYNTAIYIIDLQKANPSRPVPISLIIQFTANQMKSLGTLTGQDYVACVSSTVLFGLSLVELVPAMAINGVIAGSAFSSGLGAPIGLGAFAYAAGAAGLLAWEGIGTYGACKPLFASVSTTPSASTSSKISPSSIENRQQSERYLNLLQHQIQTDPRSCSI